MKSANRLKIKKYISWLSDVGMVAIAEANDIEEVRTILLDVVVEDVSRWMSAQQIANIQSGNESRVENIKKATADDIQYVIRVCKGHSQNCRARIEELARIRQEQEKFQQDRECGFETWDEFPSQLKEHPMFKIVTGALESPRYCAPSWLSASLDALEANERTGGEIWRTYKSDGEMTYDMVRAAMAAHRRHNQTDYDFYLRDGVSREVARELAREEIEN